MGEELEERWKERLSSRLCHILSRVKETIKRLGPYKHLIRDREQMEVMTVLCKEVYTVEKEKKTIWIFPCVANKFVVTRMKTGRWNFRERKIRMKFDRKGKV